mgnify:CR=1 FL=1
MLLALTKSACLYLHTWRRQVWIVGGLWCSRLTRSPRWSELASRGIVEQLQERWGADTKTRSISEGRPLWEKCRGESIIWDNEKLVINYLTTEDVNYQNLYYNITKWDWSIEKRAVQRVSKVEYGDEGGPPKHSLRLALDNDTTRSSKLTRPLTSTWYKILVWI